MVGGAQLQQGYAFKNGRRASTSSHPPATSTISEAERDLWHQDVSEFRGGPFLLQPGMGTSDKTWDVQGGHLFCQQTSITVPSNRGANSIHCGEGARITVQSGGAGSHHLGFENEGQVSFQDFHFEKGFLRSATAKYKSGNPIETHYILVDATSLFPRDTDWSWT